MHDLPPQGSIDDLFLPRLVAGLHLREFEGTLRLTFPEAIKVLYFKKGEIASAASNSEPDRLANILIAEGRLTAEQLALARSRSQPGASLGKTLIEMGFLSPSELLQGARQQVQRIVASCLDASTGAYEMIPGPLPPEITPLGLNTRRLLFDCLAESGDRAAIVREIGSMESVYRPTGRMTFVLASLKLDAETDRIGRLLNGASSLRDISGSTSLDDLTVGKAILGLELLGAAEKVPQAGGTAPIAARGRSIPIETEAPERPAEEAEVPAPEPVEDGGTIIEIEEEVELSAPIVPAATLSDATVPPPGVPAAATGSEAAPDEPPPIPQEELPAFARAPEAPAAAASPGPDTSTEPQWQTDPETGERVHVGPIEMTFDGTIARGGGETRSLLRLLVLVGAVTISVAGALAYVILRRHSVTPARTAAPIAAASANAKGAGGLPGTAEAAPGPVAPQAPAIVAPAASGPERASPGPGAQASPPSPVAQARAPAPVEDRPGPAQASPPSPAEKSPPEARGPIPGPPPSRPPESARLATEGSLAADARYAAAARRIEQGDAPGAAGLFQEWVAAQGAGGVTLQVMIACQEDTVKGAWSRAGAGGSLFILPYSLKGRPCYRVCWGLYGDDPAARAAAAGLPASLADPAQPLVVPLARLRAPG